MGAGALRAVRVLGRRAQLEEAHLANLHAGPQLDRQRRYIGQLKRNMPLEARINKAGGRVGQNTQTAQ